MNSLLNRGPKSMDVGWNILGIFLVVDPISVVNHTIFMVISTILSNSLFDTEKNCSLRSIMDTKVILDIESRLMI